jgi:hypothetical protein
MAQNNVTTEESSDVAPPPDLSSLMITAMALGMQFNLSSTTYPVHHPSTGAAHSHVSQTTREEKSNDDSNKTIVTTSTCVSFNFYNPSVPSPYANLHIQANALPSSPISIATTDLADSLSEEGLPDLIDDPCSIVDVNFASTTMPDTSDTALTSAASCASIPSMIPVAATNESTSAAINSCSAIEDIIPSPNDAAVVSAVNDSILNPTDTSVDPLSAAAVTIPVVASQRWYCITVGRQVGVFQGM